MKTLVLNVIHAVGLFLSRPAYTNLLREVKDCKDFIVTIIILDSLLSLLYVVSHNLARVMALVHRPINLYTHSDFRLLIVFEDFDDRRAEFLCTIRALHSPSFLIEGE